MSLTAIDIRRYTPTEKEQWNAFVEGAINSTFMLKRDYMDYHQDRFEDYSIMAYKEKKLIYVIPANRVGDKLISHAGLTYGGVVIHSGTNIMDILSCFNIMLDELNDSCIKELELKVVPDVYMKTLSGEFDYLVFLCNAKLYRTDLSYTYDQSLKRKFSNRRLRGIKKSLKYNVEWREESDFSGFWNDILSPGLKDRHGVNPVHSLSEISRLKFYFPKLIKQFNAFHDGKLVAGVTVFDMGHTAHAQYIAASDEGRKIGALDGLFNYLISGVYKDKKYFDFGVVNEDQGMAINSGLMEWKSQFGTSCFSHKFYRFNTGETRNIKSILIKNY